MKSFPLHSGIGGDGKALNRYGVEGDTTLQRIHRGKMGNIVMLKDEV